MQFLQKNYILNTVTSFLHHKRQKIKPKATANEYRIARRLATASQLTIEQKTCINAKSVQAK